MLRSFNTSLSAWASAVMCVAMFGALAACGDDGDGSGPDGPTPVDLPCVHDGACAETGGICVDGDCTACGADDECLAYGAGATCVTGVCTPCADGDLNCPCDAGTCTTGECVDNVCVECTAGDMGCVCDAGNCGEGARCNEGYCIECPPGSALCPCLGDATCEAGLECTQEVCVAATCNPGTLDCPCDGGGTCGDAMYCTDTGLCADCSSDVEGCPCEDDTCGEGLVCDEDDTCRAAVTCTELVCGAQQLCQPGEGGDASCLEECRPGYTWNGETGRCDAIVANCSADRPGSIAADCAAVSRVCVESGTGADCGVCVAGTTDEGGSLAACRPLRTCDDLASGCAAANRTCMPESGQTDAVCGACALGYREMAGTCVPIPTSNCTAGDPESLVEECALQNRSCIALATGGAACGACLPGFANDPASEACVEPVRCEELDCEATLRTCIEGPVSRCGGCADGLRLSDPTDPDSACVAALRCSDLDCGDGQACVPSDGTNDAACIDWPCELAPGVPDLGSAYREDTDTCVPCGVCTGEGLTGRNWAFTRDESNLCVCETEEGYYFGDGAVARLCDADGDGWLNRAARPAVEADDAALRANARCDVQRVDRVTLQNEFQQRLDVLLCEESVVPLFTGSETCSANGDVPVAVGLYESARNDVQETLDFAAGSADVPLYGDGEDARAPRANELTPLTRACVSLNGDYNDNNLPDVTEIQNDEEAAGLTADDRRWLQFGYFVELHRSWYEPGSPFGRLIIAEKSRCDTTFPLSYESPSDYWRSCSRNRLREFDGDAVESGYDFARFGCDAATGDCPLAVAPPLDQTADSDFDGFADPVDCEPLNEDIRPDATETCNGIDDDCDGAIDEGDVCPCPVVNYRGHAYMICEAPSTDYATARGACDALGASLVSFEDSSESRFVSTAIDDVFGGGTPRVWMGYDRLDDDVNYAWTCGSDSTYDGWAPGEPNNSGGGEACGATTGSAGNGWNDLPCDFGGDGYVCEFGCDAVTAVRGGVAAHGLCELPVLPPPDDAWRGMMHHSQFTCAIVDATVRQPGPAYVLSDELEDTGVQRLQLHSCGVACGDGETCESSIAPAIPRNPHELAVGCEAVDGGSVPADTVGFVSALYDGTADDAPTRGCMDEWRQWPELCPGYRPDSNAVAGAARVAEFGRLQCGCGAQYGGADCSIGCASGAAFDPSFDFATRDGIWTCGGPAVELHESLDPVHGAAQVGESATGQVITVRGQVVHGPSGGPMCEGADCACLGTPEGCSGIVVMPPNDLTRGQEGR